MFFKLLNYKLELSYKIFYFVEMQKAVLLYSDDDSEQQFNI